MKKSKREVSYLIIGGGFYGCCLALYLRSITDSVLLVETEDCLMSRASRVNQARIHTGFHYPRSPLTAVKSMVLHRRFMEDFPEAVIDDFQMLYGIARQHSKVSAKQFYRMFKDMGAPIKLSSASQSKLFDENMIEAVFSCSEAAFDYSVLVRQLSKRLEEADVEVLLNTELINLEELTDRVVVNLSNGEELKADYVFNITYSQINAVLDMAGLPNANLKYELSELALIAPPPELDRIGVTVMDGPFFSCMPYPSQHLYSLSHVRYTPHKSWTDDIKEAPYSHLGSETLTSKFKYMIGNGKKYLPCLENTSYVKSIFEVKAVLLKTELNDARPILFHQQPSNSRIISILGGKIDNIYDLFALLRQRFPGLSCANEHLVIGKRG